MVLYDVPQRSDIVESHVEKVEVHVLHLREHELAVVIGDCLVCQRCWGIDDLLRLVAVEISSKLNLKSIGIGLPKVFKFQEVVAPVHLRARAANWDS